MNANEQFIVKHYSEDERPTLKGHGFDGLVIGDERQEAQDFVDYLNTMLRQQQAEIEALKAGKIRAYDNGVEDGRKPNTHPANPYQSITNTKIEPTVVSYTHPVKEQITKENHVWDKGIWTVGQTESQEFIESSDFNHDVRLYLNGDFEDDTQRLNYLKHIADRLNAIDAFL